MQPAANKFMHYFVCARSNRRFDNTLNKIITPFRHQSSPIEWWSPKSKTKFLHCTLLFCTDPGNRPISPAEVKKGFERVANKIDKARLLKIEGYEITPSGHAILKLTRHPKLQTIHNELVSHCSILGLKPSVFSSQNYLPHISLGYLKNRARKKHALAELKQVFNKVKAAEIPFLAYNLELKQQYSPLAEKTLKRIDLGIDSVDHSLLNKKIVHFPQKKDAKTFAKILKDYYGIKDAKTPGSEKMIILAGKTHTIMLNQNEWNKVAGHFHNLK